jgi:type I restriction enzyme S subunit
MNAERLLRNYEKIADAPHAIARLRGFILDLAVRGKLVLQDQRDESASELLARIEHEKARLVKAGEIRKPKPLDEVHADAKLDLPETWLQSRLGNLSTLITKGSTPTSYGHHFTSSGIHFVKVESIINGILSRSTVTSFISSETHEFLRRSQLHDGDILFSIAGTIGTCAVVRSEILPANTNQALAVIRGTEHCFVPEFLITILRSRVADAIQAKARGGAMNNVSLEDIHNVVLPLPPLPEQHRIVAKVDELMALCDQLEAARAEREATRDRLAAASLARLNTPDPETFTDDAHFALDTLPALTARPDQIKQLRQTILNLAVRGKLVPQDAKDEPNEELLKRIDEELPEEKSNRTTHVFPSVDIPASWRWIRLGKLVSFSDAGWSPKTEDFPRQADEWGVLKVSAVSWDTFRPWENKQVLPGTKPRQQAVVKRGDFLISRANTAQLIARAVIVTEEPIKLMMSDKIVRLLLSEHCCDRYVWIVNNYADFAREYYIIHASGVSPSMKNVSRDVILGLPLPLPPLAEQHRIVARVDELMALCDQLEASLTAADDTRRKLLDALLADALTLVNAEQLQEAAE